MPLTPRERALVSLGAAMGSNCISCIEYHIPAARKAGLTGAQTSEAIGLADKVRQVPARKVLDTAVRLLADAPVPASADTGCGEVAPTAHASGGAAKPCGCS
ncbi:MAG TPA: carboxymuconolactone decarboxylase family protein [Burkholderiales bacterium]